MAVYDSAASSEIPQSSEPDTSVARAAEVSQRHTNNTNAQVITDFFIILMAAVINPDHIIHIPLIHPAYADIRSIRCQNRIICVWMNRIIYHLLINPCRTVIC